MTSGSDSLTDGRCRRGFVVALAALLVGLIYVAPHVAFMLELGDDYHYPFLGMVDERLYLAKIQEAYQGNFLRADPYLMNYLIGNPFLLEHKDGLYEHPPVSEILLGLLIRASGLSLEDGMVLCDFFFPHICTCLPHLFWRGNIRTGGWSLLTGTIRLQTLVAGFRLMAH